MRWACGRAVGPLAGHQSWARAAAWGPRELELLWCSARTQNSWGRALLAAVRLAGCAEARRLRSPAHPALAAALQARTVAQKTSLATLYSFDISNLPIFNSGGEAVVQLDVRRCAVPALLGQAAGSGQWGAGSKLLPRLAALWAVQRKLAGAEQWG